jgi:hypothetical protein
MDGSDMLEALAETNANQQGLLCTVLLLLLLRL